MGELTIRVTPRSSKNKIEVIDGSVKVWVTAPPADGQANETALRTLASAIGVAPSKLTLVRGGSSRIKTFQIDGLTDAEIEMRLKQV